MVTFRASAAPLCLSSAYTSRGVLGSSKCFVALGNPVISVGSLAGVAQHL